MRVVVLGSGGREHALAWKIKQSGLCKALFMLPGNGGASALGTQVKHIKTDPPDLKAIYTFCEEKKIDLLVIGSQVPLVHGICDYFSTRQAYTYVLGPSAAAAQLEGSKSYAKSFMEKYGIPTPKARSFHATQYQEALRYLSSLPLPHVLKADGLAAGKGVIISESLHDSKKWLKKMLLEKYFAEASQQILIEEYLQGTECSFFVLCDSTYFISLPYAKDYKKIGEGDKGLNTGGMGAVSLDASIDQALQRHIDTRIVGPTLEGLRHEGIPYTGFLYFGLIITDNNPYVLEYNVRLGDPEAQSILPRMDSDLLEAIWAVKEKRLHTYRLRIHPHPMATLTLASKGYPRIYEKGKKIHGLDKVSHPHVHIFHAGTREENGEWYTNGGRVLYVSAQGKTLEEALGHMYTQAEHITWEGMYYRKDIGQDMLKKNSYSSSDTYEKKIP